MDTPQLQYLVSEQMDSIDVRSFQKTSPYPWINPTGFIQPSRLADLMRTMPELDRFAPKFGYERKYGQAAHDNYVLDYREGIELSPEWQAFIDELRGDTYRKFVCRLLGTRDVGFGFQWHCAPRGTAVPPHCDSRRKIGTQIFYMNSDAEWNPEWGGQTLVLDDEGKFKRDSNPTIEDFPKCEAASIGENSSLIFGRGKKSWHAVGTLTCPEGVYRKVFIVIYEKRGSAYTMRKKTIGFLKGKGMNPDLKSNVY